ncbi:MAG: hypothetical protein NW215_10645 [Hyphomicrobiales bacterium]|nr:hypothetical protein [Hyphomicrobiales bacterium]
MALDLLIMVTDKGHFYHVEDPADLPPAEKARAHGEINPHLVRIEDWQGEVLWQREPATEAAP